jgi:UDP-N-acetylglucosamine:LPS N-acetylglucosamine transferase
MSVLSNWIAAARPRALVVDVSVEVTVLARLLGVPVITFCLPGVRTDAPHQLAWRIADAIVAPWPAQFPQLCLGLAPYRDKVSFTGGISRLQARPRSRRAARRGVVLGGLGGSALVEPPPLPGWSWAVLDARNWHSDPWPHLSSAAVVISHAGLGAIADVATAGAPAVVVAQPRPYGEQQRTAQALATGRLAAVADPDAVRWPELVEQALELGGCGWQRWADGRGAARAASVIEATAERAASGACRCMSQS